MPVQVCQNCTKGENVRKEGRQVTEVLRANGYLEHMIRSTVRPRKKRTYM